MVKISNFGAVGDGSVKGMINCNITHPRLGILLLNTVDSLVAVSYQFTAQQSMILGSHHEIRTPPPSSRSRELRPPSLLPANFNSPPTRSMDHGNLSLSLSLCLR
ncbi:MAG: hypothetical protein MJE68_27270 [Proteobacteria bacterium]|nr:hypothetical protein [Pseudomonadota bacterium]